MMLDFFKNLSTIGRTLSGLKQLFVLLGGGTLIASVTTIVASFYDEWGLSICMTIFVITFFASIVGMYYLNLLIEDIFPRTKPIPILEVIKKAESLGWNLQEDNYNILDLMDALREAGRRGNITFCGRLGTERDFDNILMNSPKEDMSAELWKDYDINWAAAFKRPYNNLSDFSDDNYRISAHKQARSTEYDIYKDLHAICPNLRKWLRMAKKEYVGRREKQYEEQKKRYAQFEQNLK